VVHELVNSALQHSLPLDRFVHRMSIERQGRVKLQQVLLNLLKNAAHAIRSRQDGDQFVLSTEDDQAVITVADNGYGMTPDVARASGSRSSPRKGEEGLG
jgi:two-component system C4-dicarboxylate transport sensor histidine kinase DctB